MSHVSEQGGFTSLVRPRRLVRHVLVSDPPAQLCQLEDEPNKTSFLVGFYVPSGQLTLGNNVIIVYYYSLYLLNYFKLNYISQSWDFGYSASKDYSGLIVS